MSINYSGITTTAEMGENMPDAVRFKPMLDFIAHHEGTANQPGGGYETSLGYGRFLPGGREMTLTSQTLAQIDSIQTFMLNNPANTFDSSALGRYQIVRRTLRSLKAIYKIQNNALFSPVMQDQLGAALIEGRGRNPIGLAQEWASLARVNPSDILRAYDQDGRTMPRMLAMVDDPSLSFSSDGLQTASAIELNPSLSQPLSSRYYVERLAEGAQDGLQAILDQRASQGWNLCQVVATGRDLLVIMSRTDTAPTPVETDAGEAPVLEQA